MGTPVSSTNKTDCHNITEILLKVSLTHFKGTDTALDLTGIYYLPDLGKNYLHTNVHLNKIGNKYI